MEEKRVDFGVLRTYENLLPLAISKYPFINLNGPEPEEYVDFKNILWLKLPSNMSIHQIGEILAPFCDATIIKDSHLTAYFEILRIYQCTGITKALHLRDKINEVYAPQHIICYLYHDSIPFTSGQKSLRHSQFTFPIQ